MLRTWQLRLADWARITVVSYDRLGRRHRHTIAGPNVVGVYNPDPSYCPYSASYVSRARDSPAAVLTPSSSSFMRA